MQSLDIEGELTIYTAAEQKDHLITFLNSGDELELNLSAVSEIDSAGLQLLILMKREAALSQKQLNFSMHSKAVLEAIECANLAAVFGDQLVLTRPTGV